MRFLGRLSLAAGLAGWVVVATPAGTSAEIVVQTSLTAGLAHHEAKAVWEQLKVGDRLELVREAGNEHDANAVRLDWRGHVLGYIPRADNASVARKLDHGNRLEARIVRIGMHRNHRRKLELEIYLRM
jgi:hypothetical protein